MQVRSTVHPSADVLQAFGLGKLDDTSAGVLMNHLDQCADCCKLVASQSGDDFLDRLRQGHGRNTTLPPANALSESVAEPKPPRPPPSNQTAIPNLPPELANNPQYDILRELGRGGMGVVYLAKNKQMDRLEVLKVVNKALLDHPGAVERFLREIRSAAKLSHANVVGAYSVPQVGDLLVFAMEYVEGQDLTAVVKAQGPLPVAHACYYVQQAALGLQHAFEKNMVHRDIKPQNLILMREGKKHIVKVLDFGLAKVMREKAEDTGLTGEGKMLGTPDYIAPEQTLDAAKADIRADIYSLGCTLYYLLAGRPPFSAASLGAILLAHQMQEAKLLNLVRPEVPEELASVVRKMMAKEPAKRYQTPLEVAQALAAFIKPAAKGGTASKSSPELSVAAPATGTANVADTSKIRTILRDVSGKTLARDTAAEAFESLGEATVSPKKAKRTRKAAKPVAAWYRRGPVLAGVGAAVLALGLGAWLLAGIVFKTKVKTVDGEAFVVLEVDQPDAEVTVDGQKISVHVPGDSKPIEIKVAPGQHKLLVRKDGFEVVSRDVELKSGKSASVRVRLEPVKVAAKPEEQPATPRPVPPAAGFVSLFNGKDLTGWKAHPDAAGDWKVENGILIGRGPKKSHLYSQGGDYVDFHLVVEAKINQGGNSGVLFHKAFTPDWQRGYEAQIDSSSHKFKTGTLYVKAAPGVGIEKVLVPVDTWFTQEVIVQGNHIIVRINGVKTVDFVDVDNTWPGGHIALQVFDAPTVVQFRRIEIKELPAAKSEVPPAAKPEAPPANRAAEEKGFVSLFNGKDLTGWVMKEKIPTGWAEKAIDRERWAVADSTIVARGKGDQSISVLLNDRDYSDFILRFDFRTARGPARGVVLYHSGVGKTGPDVALCNESNRAGAEPGRIWYPSGKRKPSMKNAPLGGLKEWNHAELEVRNGQVCAVINGVEVQSTSAHEYAQANQPTTGRIGFAAIEGEIDFRKIEIKELPAAKAEAPRAVDAAVSTPSAPRAKSDLPPEAKAAAKAFEKASADAREKLLAEFDTALERLAKSTGSTEQRLKLMDAVKEEKKRFESKGLIPFSEPMRPFVAKYFASTSAAESQVHRAYNAVIDAQLRAKNENMVADLRADLSNLLTVRVLARWRDSIDGRGGAILSLYSNGRIGGIDSKNTWTYGKGVLILRWPNPMAPGGVWIAPLKVSADGTTYAGTNNDRNRPKIRGVYVKDD